MQSIGPALAILLVAFCAIGANSVAALERATPAPGGNPAVLALLEAAEQELSAGRPEQASAVLERALRIEPRNPAIWHDLGRAHLGLGNYVEAAAMAAKSHSLAGNDRALRVSNAELMATVLKSSGRAPTSSELQVLASPRTFDLGVERARRHVDPRERQVDAELPRRWPPAEAAAQTWRDVRSPAWRPRDSGAAERAQRERAARRAEAAQRAQAAINRRYYRRYGSNEVVRRQR